MYPVSAFKMLPSLVIPLLLLAFCSGEPDTKKLQTADQSGIRGEHIAISVRTRTQKTVKFSHSVISLNQLLRNSKNTANIFLIFRNHVKIFLSRNIKCSIPKKLSIRTDKTDKTMKTLIRLLLEEQSDQDLHC